MVLLSPPPSSPLESTYNWNNKVVADQGFPVRGRRAVGEAPTSDVGAFWQKRMQKQKNWIPFGGGTCRRCPPPRWIRQCNKGWFDTLISLTLCYHGTGLKQIKQTNKPNKLKFIKQNVHFSLIRRQIVHLNEL